MTDRPFRHEAQPLSGVRSLPGKGCTSDPGSVILSPAEGRLVRDLAASCLSGTFEAPTKLLRTIIGGGQSPQNFCERLIPAAARRVGMRWCDDQLGFAEVTIACARLTRTLREAEEMEPRVIDPFCGAQALVLLPEGAQHTMGVTVLAGMLRRRGIDARLILEATPQIVRDCLARGSYDCALISGSVGDPLEKLRRLVLEVSRAAPDMPVALGGTIIDEAGGPSEITRLTGAATVGNDLDDILRRFGLSVPDAAVARSAASWQGGAVLRENRIRAGSTR